MRAMDQRNYNATQRPSVKPIETPDYIPTYQESRTMSRKLSEFFIKRGLWINGTEYFMHGTPKHKKSS